VKKEERQRCNTCMTDCMEMKEAHFEKIPLEKGIYKTVVIDVNYWYCPICGKQHQTDYQQANYMYQCFKAIPVDQLTEEDAMVIASIEAILGIEEPNETDCEGCDRETEGTVES